ncbi:hypothetical protein M426DRAFT_90309 [Hypoxylon sp. CI-4A]|nr:hypothetical protein M426DRAFT_90309 [Hypoxylon sp. CI-4A]
MCARAGFEMVVHSAGRSVWYTWPHLSSPKLIPRVYCIFVLLLSYTFNSIFFLIAFIHKRYSFFVSIAKSPFSIGQQARSLGCCRLDWRSPSIKKEGGSNFAS